MQSLQTNVGTAGSSPTKCRVSPPNPDGLRILFSCEIGDRLEDNRVSHLNNPLQKCYATGNDAKAPSGQATHKMAKQPLRLMPRKDLDKVLRTIAKLPKEAVEGVMPKTKRKKTPTKS